MFKIRQFFMLKMFQYFGQNMTECVKCSNTPILFPKKSQRKIYWENRKFRKKTIPSFASIWHANPLDSCEIDKQVFIGTLGLIEPLKTVSAWKASKYGVFSGLNTEKYRPGKTPYLGTFHEVRINKKLETYSFDGDNSRWDSLHRFTCFINWLMLGNFT